MPFTQETTMTKPTPEIRTVRVKPHSYQPTRAEMEGPVVMRNADGSEPTASEFLARVFRPMKVVEDPDA